MNLKFITHSIKGCNLRLLDSTLELPDEYIDESVSDSNYLISYYSRNKYKYSETCTINIIEKHTIDVESEIVKTIYTNHCSYLDEEYYLVTQDGYYTIHHFVLPTVDWLQNVIDNYPNYFDNDISVYVTDGYVIYQYVNGELVKSDPETLMQVNVINTTISKVTQEIFIICALYTCYINICKSLFKSMDLRCNSSNDSDLIFKRDFLWMTINILEYYVDLELYWEAQRLLEEVNYCGTFCGEQSSTTRTSGCGCH